MRIFVAFAFKYDPWVRDLVIPLLKAFGADVRTGEDFAGLEIPAAVRAQIDGCDAVIGFLTRRDGATTHTWVQHELAYASGKRRVLAVREKGLDLAAGVLEGRQWTEYDPAKRDEFLVWLAGAVGGWTRERTVTLQLLPEEAAREIRPLLRREGFQCRCRVLSGDREPSSPDEKGVTVIPRNPGGLYALVRDVPPDSLIQIELRADGRVWESDYVSPDAVGVNLVRG